MKWQVLECDQALPESVRLLARVALRETKAIGFAIYQLSPTTKQPVLKCAEGSSVPDSQAQGNDAVASFGLNLGEDGIAGLLSFVFADASIMMSARSVMDEAAKFIESIWRFSRRPICAQYAFLVGELEAKLADGKIKDRLRGVLETGAAWHDVSSRIASHIDQLLHPSLTEAALSSVEQRLNGRTGERHIIGKAKDLLQRYYGYTEEQAYVRLRTLSRQNRTRLSDVAYSVIETFAPGSIRTSKS